MQEVAVRKSFGANRSQLVRQYLGEAVMLAVFGLAIALVLVALLLPVFNNLTAKSLRLSGVLTPGVIGGMLLSTGVVGLVAGLYPAFVLSGFRPAQALRGVPGQGIGRSLLRKGLVVFQFGISIFLIAGSAVIWQQLDYFRSKQLGFDKEHVLDVRLGDDVTERFNENPGTVRNELLKHPDILAVSNASDLPGERYSVEGMRLEGQPDDESIMMRVAWRSDHDYVSALGLEIVEGRDFSRAEPADSNAWLINEAAARRFEVDDPVGRILRWDDDYVGPIVGVVRDFNFQTLHSEVEPLVIPLRPGHGKHLLVRFGSDDPREVVSFVDGTLQRLYPGSFFRHSFVGQSVDALYQDEDTLRDVLGYFSAIAIFVACLGLLGLAAFTAQQRRKEIGIRKALGASASAIVGLLSREFLILVAVAFVIAVPAVWIAATDWLDGFAYRIELNPLVFVGAGAAALLIAMATVGLQSARAAATDPVKTLRYE
jgi:putative ABC transport system permease protein